MAASLRDRINKLVDSIADSRISIGHWILILASIIALRHFLEQVSGQLRTLHFLSYFLHYPLAYLAPLLALSILLAVMARERIERVTKLMLFAWLLTLLPPLVDLLLVGAGEQPELIGYLIPKDHTLGTAFINLLNPFYAGFQGTTAGIRVEAAVGCVLAAVFVHLRTRSLGRALLTAVLVYPTMFFFFTLPSVVLTLSRLFGADLENVYQLFFARADVHRAFAGVTPFALADLSNSLVDLIVVVPILCLWYRLYSPERFTRMLRSVDPVGALYHLAATAVGIVLGSRLLMASDGFVSVAHVFDGISLFGLMAASFFAAWAASGLRLLFTESEGQEESERGSLQMITVVTGSMALLFSLSVSYVSMTYVVAMLSVHFLYYAPPLRLGRFTPLAGFMVGAVTLFAVSLGYSAYAGEQAALWLPKTVVAIAVVVPTLCVLSRDLWQARVPEETRWNLVAWLGERRARALAGIAALVAALLPAVLLENRVLAIPGAVVGVVGLVLVARARPRLIPGGLIALGLAFLLTGSVLGVADSSVLSDQLAATSFAGASRRGSNFEFMQKADATEEQGLVNEGVVLFRAGDLEGAIELFRRAIEVNPDYAHAYVSLGSAQLRLGQLEGAERSFRRAIEVEGENALAYLGLGQTYRFYGQSEEALGYVERAFELDPESADAAYTLALIHADRAQHPEEYEALAKTVELDPRHSQAYSRLADILLQNGMYAEAITALRAARAGRTPVENIHTRLADAHYSMGDLEEAESELRKEISLRPQAPSPHANLAHFLVEMGRSEEAVEEWLLAIELTSDPRIRAALEAELAKLVD